MDQRSATLPSRHSDPARAAAAAIATSHVLARTTAGLIEVGVFDALARARPAKLTVQEVAEAAMPQKVVNVKNLARMLRLMSTNGTVNESVEEYGARSEERRLYELGPVGKFFVKNHEDDRAGSFAYFLLMHQNPTVQRDLYSRIPIREFVVDQGTSRSYDGYSFTEFHRKNPAVGELFNQAMDGNSKIHMPAILDAYRGFHNVSVLVDVGGGYGASLSSIIASYPHIKGINFDLPRVIAESPELPGVEHISGNMLESVPSGGDAIFMKWILHNWEDENVLKLLKNCWRSLATGGKVIVVDLVVPEIINPEECDPAVFIADIIMMTTHDARERTEREFRNLGLAAGFAQVNVVCQIDTVGSILEMLKA